MRKSRSLHLAGLAVVLYVVADAASVVGDVDGAGLALTALAMLLAVGPSLPRGGVRGAGRVAWLAVALGVSVAPLATPPVPSLAAELAAAAGPSLAAALVVDLAIDVPDRPRRLGAPWFRLLGPSIGVPSAVLGALAALPAPDWGGGPWIVSPAASALPVFALAGALLLALPLRLARVRLGSGPADRAANGLGAVGVAGALAFGAVAVGLRAIDGPASPYARGAAALAAAVLLLGHTRMVDPGARATAGRAVRRAVAAGLSLAAAAVAGTWLRQAVAATPVAFGTLLAALLVSVAALHRMLRPFVDKLLAPAGGRLLHAVDRALSALGPAVTLEDIARAVLAPLRASGVADGGSPLLYVLDPPLVARVDLAGEPHVDPGTLPEAVRGALVAFPGQILLRSTLEARAVRRPAERPLLEELTALDAEAAVPLATSGELDGALLLPRGARRGPLALEELSALERLGAALAARVAVLAQAARAGRRASHAEAERAAEADRVRELRAEVDALRADVRRLASLAPARGAFSALVAYSPAMRAVLERLRSVAPLDAPLHLVGDPGTQVDAAAHFVHAESARSKGPFTVADCAGLRPEQAEAALFGDDEPDGEAQPGWLRLATGGTLVLLDVPALPRDVQRTLAEAFASRVARARNANGAYPVDARVVATSRVPVADLLASNALDPELGLWLAASEIALPPLRERREDLPSLVLLALDRACRTLGREPIGIDRSALEALLEHPLLGGVVELQAIVDRAVRTARGPRVMRDDLDLSAMDTSESRTPSAGVRDALPTLDSLDGTYEELERRILTHALARANGNKSEAARLLALKRTTFIDKLRRYDIDGDHAPSRPPAPPQGPRAT